MQDTNAWPNCRALLLALAITDWMVSVALWIHWGTSRVESGELHYAIVKSSLVARNYHQILILEEAKISPVVGKQR